jgi:uncharacterized protein
LTSATRTTAPRSRGRGGATGVRRWGGRAAALAVCAAATLASGAATRAAERTFPAPRGYVSDFAEILPGAYRDSIESLCAELERKAAVQVAVVTVSDLGGDEIEPYAVDLFASWGIGKKGRDEGVLILLARRERRVRIEVGYGLEGILPDGRCGGIIRRVMGPDLAADRFGPGILRGAEAVAAVIARDREVALDRPGAGASALADEERGPRHPLVNLIILAVILLVVTTTLNRIVSSHGGWAGGEEWSDWRTRRRRGGPWGGFGGGMGGFGGFGGFGGGGGGGGGFGGFGGGRSGGGGASGGF